MEQLKSMKEALMAQACSQMGNLQQVDAKELGEVIDMIKDIEEAIYYCTITKAMGQKDEQEQMMRNGAGNNTYYYTEKMMPYPYYCYDDYYYKNPEYGRYYSEGGNMSNGNHSSGMSSNSSNGGSRNYSEREFSDWNTMRDEREGKSPMRRRMYMESKEMHKESMPELEKYLQELSSDIMEMIKDATPEERQMLQKKLALLSTKINA